MFSFPMRPCSPGPVCGPAPVPHMPHQPVLQRFGALIDRHVTRPMRCWRERERLYAELCRADHRELKDLGISRGDIPALVANWRPKH